MTDHLSRRFATGPEILGDRYAAACDLATGIMEGAVDQVITRLCAEFNMTQIQAHIVWDEIFAWMIDPDRVTDNNRDDDNPAIRACLIPGNAHPII